MKGNLQHNRNAHMRDCERTGKRWMRDLGLACMAFGMVIGFVAVMIRGNIEFTSAQQTIVVLAAIGIAFLGFGTGWQCHEETDRESELE